MNWKSFLLIHFIVWSIYDLVVFYGFYMLSGKLGMDEYTLPIILLSSFYVLPISFCTWLVAKFIKEQLSKKFQRRSQ
jgi:hypothetical protein